MQISRCPDRILEGGFPRATTFHRPGCDQGVELECGRGVVRGAHASPPLPTVHQGQLCARHPEPAAVPADGQPHSERAQHRQGRRPREGTQVEGR